MEKLNPQLYLLLGYHEWLKISCNCECLKTLAAANTLSMHSKGLKHQHVTTQAYITLATSVDFSVERTSICKLMIAGYETVLIDCMYSLHAFPGSFLSF